MMISIGDSRRGPARTHLGWWVLVEALEPRIMVQLTGREELDCVAQEAAERLEAALAELKD